MKRYSLILLCSLVVFLMSCHSISFEIPLKNAAAFYNNLEAGHFSGRLLVEWKGIDSFSFIPDETQPFRYIRANGEVIQPGPMVTDFGSIPQFAQILKSYSRTGYGAAYIIHDWIFVRYRRDEIMTYTFEDSALIMAEAVKTLMEDPEGRYGGKDIVVLYSLYLAVKSPVAFAAWQSEWDVTDTPRAVKETLDSYEIIFP